MSSSFDSGGPRDPDNLPFGWIVVDGQPVFAADYWQRRAEAAEAEVVRLKQQVSAVLKWQDRSCVVQDFKRATARAEAAEEKLALLRDWCEDNVDCQTLALRRLLDD